MAQLDHHTNLIMSAVRTQHEELKRRLKTDFTHVVKPVEDELRRCSSLKTSIHQLMKKVSDIKRTVDSGLRISVGITRILSYFYDHFQNKIGHCQCKREAFSQIPQV